MAWHGFSYVSRIYSRPLLGLHESTFACSNVKAMPGHATLFVFNGLALAGPPGSSEPLFAPFDLLVHGHTRRFSPISYHDLQGSFLPLIFPRQHTTTLKIIRGVGSNAGNFSQVADRGSGYRFRDEGQSRG